MQEQHGASESSEQEGITDPGQYHSTEQQVGAKQETATPEFQETHNLSTDLSPANVAAVNPLSTLVNYSSSDEET